MAACRADASRISNRSAGDAACEGGIVGDDGEVPICCGWDGSSRCAPNRLDRRRIRALLVARKQLLGRLLDLELSIRGSLRGFGLKAGQVTRKAFEARIRELVTGQATLGAGRGDGLMRTARVRAREGRTQALEWGKHPCNRHFCDRHQAGCPVCELLHPRTVGP